jgi:hypothetical protein
MRWMTKWIAALSTMAAIFICVCSVSCKSEATTICDLECDCEHCNDFASEVRCDERNAEHDVADAYGCADVWDTWATCYEDKGSCDESKATYSTVQQTAGSCSNESSTGKACPNGNSDCTSGVPDQYCAAGMCKFKSCAGSGVPCTSNSQCSSGGQDRCASEQKTLGDCVTKASAHGGEQTSTGSGQPTPGGG